MPEPKKTYESLPEDEKIMLLNKTLDFLVFKPSLIGDVKTDEEYLDRLERFSKTLYERFPNFKRKSSVTMVPLEMG
jgi:hypothetical protein